MTSSQKVAVVTGASKGLGRAIAISFAKEKYAVVINYNSSEKDALKVLEECKKHTNKAVLIKGNVGKFEEVELMFETIKKEFGQIDVLVNNAGITRDRTLKNMTLEEWDDVLKTNLYGVFHTTKLALPLIQNNGRIINISSIAGVTGNFGQTNYAATKSALFGFTKSLAKEVGKKGITANVVAPGFLESEMTDKIPFLKRKLIVSMTSLDRAGTFEEVANVVVFLASEKAAYITAEVINVNGGLGM